MKTPAPQSSRGYEAIVKRNGKIVDSIEITATDRRKAVHSALLWFWYKYYGSMGLAHRVLTVNDPYNEVHYGPRFVCSNRMNKFLPHHVAERVIEESRGELELDKRNGSPHHPANSVKRVKRRRDFGKFIAPCIKQMRNGTMYYRVTLKAQRSRQGRMIRRRKYQDIRLKARTIVAAIDEIKIRKLQYENERITGRKMKVRDLALTAHLANLITCTLTVEQQKKFSRVMVRYERPKTSISAA